MFLVFGRGEIRFMWAHDQPAFESLGVRHANPILFDPPEFGRFLPRYQSIGVLTELQLPLWIPSACALTAAGFVWIWHFRHRDDHACRCGYALAGLTSDTCPECGRTIKKPTDA